MTSWELKKLSDVCEVIMGQSPPGNTYNKNGTGLPFFQGKTDFGSFYPTPSTWCTKPKKIAEPNDILISVRAPVGPTNMCNLRCCIGRGLTAIRTKDKINPKFVLYYLRSVEADITSMGTGSTFQAISKSQIANLEIPLAPVPVQKLIVSEIEKQFSRLDEAVAALKRVRASLKRYKASVLKAAVEGKLTEEWRKQNPDVEPADKLLKRILSERKKKWEETNPKKKYKEPSAPDTSNLPELPKGWVWATVGALADNIHYGYTASSANDTVGPNLLRITDIQNNTVKWDAVPYCKIKPNEKQKYLLKDGDLVFARTGATVGKSFLIRGNIPEAVFASYLIRIILSNHTDKRFIYNFFQSLVYWMQIHKGKIGIGQPNVNAQTLSQITLPLPPLIEQQKIVDEIESRLSVAEEIKETIDINLKRVERLRQAILKKAFSGRLVTQDLDDEHVDVLNKVLSLEGR